MYNRLYRVILFCMIEKCTHFNTIYYYTVHLTTTVVGDNDQCSLRINENIVYIIPWVGISSLPCM